MTITTREARQEDLVALCHLLAELFSQEREFQPDECRQRRGLEAILANECLGRIIVAELDGRVVGMASVLSSVSTALGARVAILEDVVVEAAQRRRGVGAVLLRSAIEHARETGHRRITLLTDEDNHVAQRFYEKAGFRRSSMVAFRLHI